MLCFDRESERIECYYERASSLLDWRPYLSDGLLQAAFEITASERGARVFTLPLCRHPPVSSVRDRFRGRRRQVHARCPIA